MTKATKTKIRVILNSNYGKQMIKINGLRFVKKEIFHGIKNEGGDERLMSEKLF
jgi:hypothetical protein